MRPVIVVICLLLPLCLSAQRKLDYQLQVQVDLLQKTFAVQGSLSFETTKTSADSVDITISRGVGEVKLQLEGAKGRMDTSINASGDKVYRWYFSQALPAGTGLRFTYAYERGSAPTFQYYLDSIFCMAGGYGSAWYPQVISREEDSTGSYTRGTGTIAVTTPANIMAVMAAGTLNTTAVADKRTYTFHYTQPDIFSLYIGNYSRQEYKGNRSFYTYSLSTAIDGNDLSRKSAAVLDFLSAQFGPLTIPNFSIIEFPEYVSELTGIGGASILGGVVMPTGALRQFNYALFGHEIGHQWWGNKVRSRGERGASIISEALAQYSSLQVVYHFDSTHAADYRRTGYPGYIKDQCGLGYLKNVAAGNDEPLVALTGANDHILADSKGFLALEFLSATVGKPVFNKAMQVIGEKYSSRGVSWEDFQGEIEKAYGHRLQWLFDQWFERTGVPEWQSSWQQQQNKLRLTVTQKDSIYQLPLEVMIRYSNGTTSLQHITIRDRSQTLQLPVNGSVTAVQLDPYFKVLHWEEALVPIAMSQAKVIKVQNLRLQDKSAEAISLAQSYLKEGIPDDSAGVEFTLLYQLGRMTAVQNKPEEALAYYQRSLQCVSRAPELLAYTYYRIAQLAAAKKDTTLLQWACANAVKADKLNHRADGMEARAALLLATAPRHP
ncbi:M1 family aminopeptidase [Chitinophaga sp. RAB17]|uniref:M1 family aminopeptidase n=1 Tax=Chitinophaga sp. RAB17 TaxID=3233049 RepID=UPI003F935376